MVNRLKEVRTLRNMSIYKLGLVLGKTYGQISQYERVNYPSIKAIHEYNNALNLTEKEVYNIVMGNPLTD